MKWPQRIIDELGREPRVGDWFAECCIEDFQQLTDDTLAEVLALYSDEDSGGMFWRAEDGDAARAFLERGAGTP